VGQQRKGYAVGIINIQIEPARMQRWHREAAKQRAIELIRQVGAQQLAGIFG
jgi:hypothetical protein